MIGLVLSLALGVAPLDGGQRSKSQAKTAQEAAETQALLSYELDHPRFDAGTLIPPFRWRISNIIREMPIDGPQVANDVPVKLHGVLVKGRQEDVLLEVIDNFRASGLYLEPPESQSQPMRQIQVTALDQQRAISYTAMVDALANGTCMVVLGEANLGIASYIGLQRKAKKEEMRDFAPLMPDAIAPFRTDAEQMHTVAYSVSATEEEVRKFYQEQLRQRGFTEAEPNLFRNGGDEISLRMRRDKSRLDVLLTLRAAEPKGP